MTSMVRPSAAIRLLNRRRKNL